MDNYDIIIFCGGKCGGTTLANTFQKNGYKTLHMHGENSPGMFNPKIKLNKSVYEIIDYSASQHKVYVIDSYRTPLERNISAFFQQIDNDICKYENISIEVLCNIFNENYLRNEDYHPLNKIMTHYNLNTFSVFDFSKGYNIVEKDNMVFIKLRFEDIFNWGSILTKIIGKKIIIYPENLTKNKKSGKLYSSFKNLYKPSESYIKNFIINDMEFKIYNKPTEQISYIDRWKGLHKSLIGKNGYLFLQNDSSKELKIHCENLCLVSDVTLKRYMSYKDKYFFVVFPDKSYICKDFLPDSFDSKYRPGFNIYKDYFKEKLLDGYEVLKDIDDIYYKTDSHMNLKGAYEIYCKFIDNFNETSTSTKLDKQNLIIEKRDVSSLNILGVGIGDLMWVSNLGNQTLLSTTDNYYYSNNLPEIYLKYKIVETGELRIMALENKIPLDKTANYLNTLITWPILSCNFIYKKNEGKPKYKCLIFYDSFLLSTLSLYLRLFEEMFLAKSAFHKDLIDAINPDYIFEFRIERFLT
jgi:hypothetical protein